MIRSAYRRHRFSPDIIQYAVWLNCRFTLSYRDIEDLLAERGIDISYETVRRWVLKFGTLFARRLRRLQPRPHSQWHLDEVFVSIGGYQMYLWRARPMPRERFWTCWFNRKEMPGRHQI